MPHERMVGKCQSLQWCNRCCSQRYAHTRIRRIEDLEKRNRNTSNHEAINAAAEVSLIHPRGNIIDAVFRRMVIPEAKQIKADLLLSRSTQLSSRCQDSIPNLLCMQTSRCKAPVVAITFVLSLIRRVRKACLLIGRAHDDQTVDMLDGACTPQLGCQKVKQLRDSRSGAIPAKVIWCFHQALTKMRDPNPVCQCPPKQRIIWRCDPLCKRQTAIAFLRPVCIRKLDSVDTR